MPLNPGSKPPPTGFWTCEGASVAPAAWRTLPTVVCFVKASCPACRFALPVLDAMHESLGRPDDRIAVIAQEAAPAAVTLADDLGIKLPVLLDPAPYAASRAWGVHYVPTCFLLDEEGRVEAVSESFVAADLEAFNDRLATAVGRAAQPFHGDDPLPAFRPG